MSHKIVPEYELFMAFTGIIITTMFHMIVSHPFNSENLGTLGLVTCVTNQILNKAEYACSSYIDGIRHKRCDSE